MRFRWLPFIPAFALLLSAAPAGAAANPWLERRVLNMTHQGGEDEHPSGTMYALRESLGLGADMLELDVQPTEDGHLVVLHDQSVKRTTGRARSVYDLSLREVRRLDAARHFVPGRGAVPGLRADAYPLRGVRTGKVAPPLGYTRRDFAIPTLEEVLRAFPKVPMNIEIKGRSDADTASFLRNADRLVRLLRRVAHPPLVVVSFNQEAVDRFHAALPDVAIAPGISGTSDFVLANRRPAGSDALQVPPRFGGVQVMTPDFVRRAHAAELAVHVWFSGQEESPRVYRAMLDMGVDGLMPARPRALERVLCARDEPRPAGNPNHCGGGRRAAARRCLPRVRAVGPVDRRGLATVAVRRAADRADVACGGTVRLTPSGGRSAAGRFLLPYGVLEARATVRLPRGLRARLSRGARVSARAGARTDRRARSVTSRVTLRAARR